MRSSGELEQEAAAAATEMSEAEAEPDFSAAIDSLRDLATEIARLAPGDQRAVIACGAIDRAVEVLES